MVNDLSKYLNKIIQGDSLKILRQIPDNSIDGIFADPPYNMQLKKDLSRPDASHVDAVNDDWDKFKSFKTYDEFTYAWLAECKRILKKDGTMWVIGSYHNIFRVGTAIQNLDFWVLNDIVWVKNNPMPNFKGTRFTNAHETLIWCSKSEKSKYTFNYESMKAFNEDIQMRSDWNLPICSGGERLKNAAGTKVHSTQKPESLLYRVIMSSTNVGDVILDPFFGSGTTGAVAKKLGRNFIGIERDAEYVREAQQRIDSIGKVSDFSVFEPVVKEKVLRIPFGSVLEKGLLKAGDELFDSKANVEAQVMADGSIQIKDSKTRGSIHQVGAIVQDQPSCNGWTFWHYKDSKKHLEPIDTLRQEIRKEIEDAIALDIKAVG